MANAAESQIIIIILNEYFNNRIFKTVFLEQTFVFLKNNHTIIETTKNINEKNKFYLRLGEDVNKHITSIF